MVNLMYTFPIISLLRSLVRRELDNIFVRSRLIISYLFIEPVKIISIWKKFDVYNGEARVSLFCEAEGSDNIKMNWYIIRPSTKQYPTSWS